MDVELALGSKIAVKPPSEYVHSQLSLPLDHVLGESREHRSFDLSPAKRLERLVHQGPGTSRGPLKTM